MGLHILLVEDDPIDQTMIQRTLTDIAPECAIKVYDEGASALEYIYQGHRPDFILVDLNMPGVDGKEVLKTLKGDEKFKKIPILILSGSSRRSDINECYTHSANAYLVKPSSVEGHENLSARIHDFWIEEAKLPQ